ncbi:MAG TPA: hypothetical protein VNU97_01765 [Rhizomicrobium sp.]|nr:hypothetical protein [Rhizomicrobium sp.]
MAANDPNLRRYWFEFESLGQDTTAILKLGCGVTAYDEKDATALIRDRIFSGAALPHVRKIVADIDVRSLDQDHVVPNMGSVVWRGIWFPTGYEHNG